MKKQVLILLLCGIMLNSFISHSKADPLTKLMNTNLVYGVSEGDYLVYEGNTNETNIRTLVNDEIMGENETIKEIQSQYVVLLYSIYDEEGEFNIDRPDYELLLEISYNSANLHTRFSVYNFSVMWNSTFSSYVTQIYVNNSIDLGDYDIDLDTQMSVYLQKGTYTYISAENPILTLMNIANAQLNDDNEFELQIDEYDNVTDIPNYNLINESQWGTATSEYYTINKTIASITEPMIIVPSDLLLEELFCKEYLEAIVYIMSDGAYWNLSFYILMVESMIGMPLTEDNYTIEEEYGINGDQGYLRYLLTIDVIFEVSPDFFINAILIFEILAEETVNPHGKITAQKLTMNTERYIYIEETMTLADYEAGIMQFEHTLIYDSNPYIAPIDEEITPPLLSVWEIVAIVIGVVTITGGIGLYYFMNRTACAEPNSKAILCAGKYRTYKKDQL